jgi:glycosyltransferase involved in cell wall biosynthesis
MTEEQTQESAKKTIVIATDNFMPRIDGIARFLNMLIPSLKEFNVIVIAPDYKGKFEKTEDYDIYRVPLHNIMVGDYIPAKNPSKEMLAIIDKADLVFTQTIGPIGSTVIKYAHKKAKTVIAFIHSIEWILVEKSISPFNLTRTILSRFVMHFAKNLYNKCDMLIVPSEDVAEIFYSHGITSRRKVVHLGIDLDYFVPGDKEKAKAELGYHNDDFVIGYVGRIAREKDLMTLKNAFRKLEGHNKLLLVGSGIPSLEKELQGKNVTITGTKYDIVKYLQAMDVFVMPSLTETTCLAALEAMACELPVISTKVGSLKDYLVSKKNGLFFPKHNETVLSLQLKYLQENSYKRRSFGQNGRKTVVKDYNWKGTVSEILKILRLYSKGVKVEENV